MRDHGLPSDPEDTADGNAAHYYLALLLQGTPPPVGSIDPAGTVITKEMADGAGVLFAAALPYLFQPERYEVLIEHTFAPSPLIFSENWGTPDLVVIDRVERVIRIFDFKYGWRVVEEFFNDQLVNYAALVAHYVGLPLTGWGFELSICQPRVYHDGGKLRTWKPEWPDLIEAWGRLARMSSLAWKALESPAWPDMAATAGPHCRDCANHACAVFRKSTFTSIHLTFAPMPVTGPVRAEDAALLLRQMQEAAAHLKAAIAGLEGDLLARTATGQLIPGIERGYKKTNEAWKLDAETVAMLADAHGVDIRKPGVLTPVQARTLGLDDGVISQLSHRPPGKPEVRVVSEKSVAKAFR